MFSKTRNQMWRLCPLKNVQQRITSISEELGTILFLKRRNAMAVSKLWLRQGGEGNF